MAAVRKTPVRPTDSPFNLSIPFAPKTTRARAPRKQDTAKPVDTVETTKTALPVTAVAERGTPIAPPVAAEPVQSKRRRLAKAFDRPLDKVLRKNSEAVVPTSQKAPRATVRDGFTFPKVEHDRLVELKKVLAVQGIDVKKSDLIRAGLILALALPQAKLKSILAKLPPVK